MILWQCWEGLGVWGSAGQDRYGMLCKVWQREGMDRCVRFVVRYVRLGMSRVLPLPVLPFPAVNPPTTPHTTPYTIVQFRTVP